MANEVVYEISAKNKSGKWWGYGRVTRNPQYGSLQIGMKKTPELVALLDSTPAGGWINLSLFEPKGGAAERPKKAASKPELDDEIPF